MHSIHCMYSLCVEMHTIKEFILEIVHLFRRMKLPFVTDKLQPKNKLTHRKFMLIQTIFFQRLRENIKLISADILIIIIIIFFHLSENINNNSLKSMIKY